MADWKPLDEMSVISKYHPRLEAADKVTGKASYTFDQAPKGVLYGALLSAAHPAAKVVNIDDSKVRKLPGIRAVLTDIHPSGTVRYAGESIAAVAATSPDIAKDALELFDVTYDVKEFAADIDTAMQEGAPKIFDDRENIRDPRVNGEGDIENGFSQADEIVESEYRTQVQTHSCLETHGSLAMWEGDELTIYDSTQAVHGVREGVARNLDIPASKVRVICKHMGGGFGSKLQTGHYSAVAARLSRQAGAPVKLMLSRKQDFLQAGNRPNSIQKLKLGAKKDGTITALEAITYGTAGVGTGANVTVPFVYEFNNWHHKHHDVFTNAGGGRPFRAPGRPQAAFGMEQLMDEMAEKIGMDALEFRLKNDTNQTRQKEWRIAAEKIGWSGRNMKPGSGRGPVKTGIGMGASIWGAGGGGTKSNIKVFPDGGVEVRIGTQDLGTGSRTLIAAIVAEELGLEINQVLSLVGDSEFPRSGSSGGSTTSPSVSPAAKNVAEKARAELTKLAASHFQTDNSDVVWGRGQVSLKSDPSKKLLWNDLCKLLENEHLEVFGEWVEGLSSRGVAGCQFAEVAVDTETGRIEVKKVVAVADCGLIINRLTTESQVNGAVLQGISYALYEDRLMDPTTGTMVNTDFENYKIIGTIEAPEIDITLFDEAERGVIGIGEPPTIPTSAAIANAVYNAIGVRLREIPMTPDKVLNALSGASS
jgi:xanthine dehydrogenase YagR molybdenum-binding subunit